MANMMLPNDSPHSFEQNDRSVRRAVLTVCISLALALGVGFAAWHALGRGHGGAALAPSSIPVAGNAAPAVTTRGSVPAAAVTLASARPSGAAGVQAMAAQELPAPTLRALARTDTNAAALGLVFYIVGTQAEADDLQAGLAAVYAIRATGGAPALQAAVVVDGPSDGDALLSYLASWPSAQVIDLR